MCISVYCFSHSSCNTHPPKSCGILQLDKCEGAIPYPLDFNAYGMDVDGVRVLCIIDHHDPVNWCWSKSLGWMLTCWRIRDTCRPTNTIRRLQPTITKRPVHADAVRTEGFDCLPVFCTPDFIDVLTLIWSTMMVLSVKRRFTVTVIYNDGKSAVMMTSNDKNIIRTEGKRNESAHYPLNPLNTEMCCSRRW